MIAMKEPEDICHVAISRVADLLEQIEASDLPEETGLSEVPYLTEEIETEISNLAELSLLTCSIQKDIPKFIANELEKIYGPTWHVFVGENEERSIPIEPGYCLGFTIRGLQFFIFKSGYILQ